MSSSIRILKVALICLASLALALELSTRLYLFGVAGLHPVRVNSVRNLGVSGLVQPSSNPAIGYELKPNQQAYLKLARLETNSQGLRDREYEVSKPRETFRIAVLGSSFSMAPGVEIDRTFHELIEEKLNRRSDGRSYEVINFGIGGYKPQQILATLEAKARGYDPDLILFCLTQWTAEEMFAPADKPPQPFVQRDPTHPFFHSFLLKLVLHRRNLGDVVDTESDESRDRTRPSPVIERLARFSRSTGIPVLIVWLGYEFPGRLEPAATLESLALAHDLQFVDTRTHFENTVARDFWIYELDAHPNASAHSRFYEGLYDFLVVHYVAPRRP